MRPPDAGQDSVDHVEWQLERFRKQPEGAAFVWRGRTYSFEQLTSRYHRWLEVLEGEGVGPGSSVGIIGDYSPAATACLLAMIRLQAVAVPLAREYTPSSFDLPRSTSSSK